MRGKTVGIREGETEEGRDKGETVANRRKWRTKLWYGGKGEGKDRRN